MMQKRNKKQSLNRRHQYLLYYSVIRRIPDPIKRLLRTIYYVPIDIIDNLRGQDDLTPPRSLITGSRPADFKNIGEEFKNYFIELGNLKPDDRVLDIGCGIGRMAVPLTSYLSPLGEYYGFDIDKRGIEWCQKQITPRFNNFHFQRPDIYNKFYNANGKYLAHEYKFPYDDNYFEFVILYSVFTHLLPGDLRNYLSEISRVLRPGGRCLTTFFLLNNETEPIIQSGVSAFDFKFRFDGYTTIDKDTPEGAIAYDEKPTRDLYKQNGLDIMEPICFGWWCGRDTFKSFQDIIAASKQHTSCFT